MSTPGTEGRPTCECHGESMQRDGRYWRCAIKRRARGRRDYKQNPERAREAWRRRYEQNGDQMREANLRRGRTPRGRTYKAWYSARRRCTSPKDPGWHHYGGRGIAMCDRWHDSFEAFLTDMGECPEGLTLDRIDNNGDYEPDNCRWATWKQQRANRRGSAVSA